MAPVNKTLHNRAIRHAAYLQSVANGEARWARQQFYQYRLEIIEAIAADILLLEPDDIITPTQQMIINRISQKIQQINSEFMPVFTEKLMQRIRNIAENESEFERRLYNKVLPEIVDISGVSVEVIHSALASSQMAGKALAQWWAELGRQTADNITTTLKEGILAGATVDELVTKIKGAKRLSYEGSIIGKAISNAEALASTATMWANSVGRVSFFQRNQTVVKNYSVIITLDRRTCAICISKAAENPYEVPPKPPFHPRCRCVVVANTKGWRELGIDADDLTPTQRAAMDGTVPEETTYPQWFRSQPERVQRDILGDSRYELWASGQITLSAFADRGQIFNLDELRRRESDIFNIGLN